MYLTFILYFILQSDAAAAVLKTDNTVIDGMTISVAISNPPAKNPTTKSAPFSTSRVPAE